MAAMDGQSSAKVESGHGTDPDTAGVGVDVDKTMSNVQISAFETKLVYKSIVRDVMLSCLPTLFLLAPLWAAPRALRPDADFTAKEFRAECDATGSSENEDAIGTIVLTMCSRLLLCAFAVSIYYALPIERFCGTPQSEETVKRVVSIRRRWGAAYTTCWAFYLAIKLFWAPSKDYSNGPINLFASLIAIVSNIFFSIGVVRQGINLEQPWAEGRVAAVALGVGFFVWLAICQQIMSRGPDILAIGRYYPGLGLAIVVVLSALGSLAELACKKVVVKTGIHSSFFGFLSLNIGVCSSLPIRIYQFMLPSIAQALFVGLVSSGQEILGHLFNIFKIRCLTKVGLPFPTPKTLECQSWQLYTSAVFEITARVLALILLLTADSRYFIFAGVGFRYTANPVLVIVNFVIAAAMALATNLAVVFLFRALVPEMNVAAVIKLPARRTFILAFTLLIAVSAAAIVDLRYPCLRCGPPDATVCFDA